jgi:hypothetical protein
VTVDKSEPFEQQISMLQQDFDLLKEIFLSRSNELSNALVTLSGISVSARAAANREALSAQHSFNATRAALVAATDASDQRFTWALEAAAQTAWKCAEDVSASAASATESASVCATAVSHQTEEISVLASRDASAAASKASSSAAEAVTL